MTDHSHTDCISHKYFLYILSFRHISAALTKPTHYKLFVLYLWRNWKREQERILTRKQIFVTCLAWFSSQMSRWVDLALLIPHVSLKYFTLSFLFFLQRIPQVTLGHAEKNKHLNYWNCYSTPHMALYWWHFIQFI